MREIKALFLVLLCSAAIGNLGCPVFAENEIAKDNSPTALIPLDASYDTNYQAAAESNNKPESSNKLESFNESESTNKSDSSSRPLLNAISLRKIIPIVFESPLDSRLVCIGDQVTARLKEDLYYGRSLMAPKNSLLKGRVVSCRGARTLSDAMLQKEDRLKSSGAVEIRFNELIIGQNKSIPLVGLPVHQESTWLGADGYTHGIQVDHQGRIVGAGRTLSQGQKDSSNFLRVATFAPTPGNLIVGIVAAPVVMGAVGAASPDVAFNKPIDRDVKHRRLKGMAYGFVTNLPGAFFVQAVVEKGNDIVLSKGDELMIDLAINGFSNYQTASIDQANVQSTVLAVKAQVMDHQPARLLPASPTGQSNSAGELALKPFIPSSD